MSNNNSNGDDKLNAQSVAVNTSSPQSDVSQKSFLRDICLWFSIVWALLAPVIYIHQNYHNGISSFINGILVEIGLSHTDIRYGIVRMLGGNAFDVVFGEFGIDIYNAIWNSVVFVFISLAIFLGIGLIVYGMISWGRKILKSHNIQESCIISKTAAIVNSPSGLLVISIFFIFAMSKSYISEYLKFNRFDIISKGNIAYKIDRQENNIKVLMANEELSMLSERDKAINIAKKHHGDGIARLISGKKGNIVFEGWKAKSYTGCYLVSYQWQENENSYGYWYEVNVELGVIRSVLDDNELRKKYGFRVTD